MNRTFDFLLSGISSLVKLGKDGNSIRSEKDSHVEFRNSLSELIPVRTKNPVDLKDSVNLEYLRDNVILSFGNPVQNTTDLRTIPSNERRDKQIRFVEDSESFYQFDAQSIAVEPNPDIIDQVIVPNDIIVPSAGRWIKTRARIQFHNDLIGSDLGDDHPQYQLRIEKNQPEGYAGLDYLGFFSATTDNLNEGLSNLYFTGDRARTEVVDDFIANGIINKAPSQNSVFLALAGKENAIPDSVINKFLNGLKEFISISISDITDLQTSLDAIVSSIPSVTIQDKTLWNNEVFDAGSITGNISFTGFNLNRVYKAVLTGNTTFTAISGGVEGNVYVMVFTQNASGNFTLSLPANIKIPTTESIDLGVNTTTILTMYYDGVNYLGSFKKGWI